MKTSSRAVTVAMALFAALTLLAAPAQLQAARRITYFHSQILVNPDSTMTVTETITYRTEERKRGIVREFPTTYQDSSGNTIKVDFTVLEVLRDGQKEPYHIEKVSNGEKVFVGRKDVFLSPGVYVYTLQYRTDRQLGYFQDHDELYWNVTGNGWELPIDIAEAVIQLPPGAKILEHTAYTGYQRERGQDYTVKVGENDISFKTTRRLAPQQGLTVVVSWPKGVVRAPAGTEKLGFFLRDNTSAGVGLLGLFLLLAYYLYVWSKVGRDPTPGTIIPLYQPPKGFSPADTRYLMEMGFDNKAMAAAVVDMAVKGYLKIEEAAGGLLSNPTFTLRKKDGNPAALSNDEARTASQLFLGGDAIELKSENHTYIKDALEALKDTLKKKEEKTYFVTNLDRFIPGVVLTFLILGAMILTSRNLGGAGFSALWLTIWTVGCCFLAYAVYQRWHAVREGAGFGKVLGALVLTLFAVPFFLGEIFGIGFIAMELSAVGALAFAGMVFLNPLFYHLLKAPTLAGRRLMDQIEGFKLFLSVAEKERLNLLNPPEKTPELFEKYLPFALALDVEVQWSEQFAAVLAQAAKDGTMYQPSWYSGGSWDSFTCTDFTSSLGSSFSDAISSSSSPPGSGSGFGGGGFSGGGGGGGGGGDW